MFKKKHNTEVVRMVPGYKFEFEVTALNVEDPVLFDAYVAKFKWYLFKGRDMVDDGTHSIFMDSEHAEEEMFLFGRRKALDHADRVRDETRFPYSNTRVMYELPASMTMSRKVYSAYCNVR